MKLPIPADDDTLNRRDQGRMADLAALLQKMAERAELRGPDDG